MTAIKRPRETADQSSSAGLSKTERRRLAKRAKKERERGQAAEGGKGNKSAASTGAKPKKGKQQPVKITKEERRAKYTQKAYEAREKRTQAGPGANKTRCLGCRAWGHVLASCPNAKANTGICFNCGSSKHALRACPKPTQKDGSLPHATCFVCKAKGHVSAHCEQNANGIYPKGGFCKGCGSKHHLSRDCPENPQQKADNPGDSVVDSAEEKPVPSKAQNAVEQSNSVKSLMSGNEPKRQAAPSPRDEATGKPMARHAGGDDLEDDDYYDPEDVPNVQDDSNQVEGPAPRLEGPRKAQGKAKKPKVVVF